MATPNRPPLWEVMQDAGSNAPGTPRDAIAAEIRALRDWLVPEEPLYDGDQRWELERDVRQRLLAVTVTQPHGATPAGLLGQAKQQIRQLEAELEALKATQEVT